ncbi:P68 family surface lipoprotein [Mycoplasma buteonis]|uniref:P68 family surface lipoprotein n=1 Tax=Mycoplasma buteonis TaxID=171280 RepID=UPI0005634E3B|nr:P80 family lipoprotein [Mycoplasma buteonis]
MNFKFNKKILLGLSGVLAAGTPLLVAASCDDTKTNKEETTEPGTVTPEPGTGEITPEPGTVTPETEDSNISDEEQERIDNALSGANPTAANQSFKLNEGRKEILIGNTFSSTNTKGKALEKLMAAYNEYLAAEKAKNPQITLLPVKSINMGSGYSKGSETLELKLKSKDTENTPNIVINYPPAAAKLAAKNMLLSFNSGEEQFNVDIDDFDAAFTKQNFTIANIQNPSTYSLPLLKSTNVMAVNGPVLYYIVKSIVDNGGKVADDAETTAFYAKLKEVGEKDFDSVKSLWGLPVTKIQDMIKAEMDKGEDKSLAVFRKGYFQRYDDLLKFSTFAQSLFTQSYNNGDPANAGVHVFGIDGPPSFFGSTLFSLGNGELENTFSKITKTNGVTTVDFTTLLNDGTAKKNAQKIYDALSTSVTKGATVLQPGGAYSSSSQIQHKFAFSTGSTSGFEHNYVPLEKSNGWNLSSRALGDVKYDIAENNKMFRSIRHVNLEKFNKDLKEEFGSLALAESSRYNNPIYPDTVTSQQLQDSDQKHAVRLSTPEDTKRFKEKFEAMGDKALLLFIQENDKMKSYLDTFTSSKYYAGKVTLGGNADSAGYLLIIPNGLPNADSKGKFNNGDMTEATQEALKSLQFTLEKTDSTTVLNENELLVLPTPYFWDSKTKTGVVFGQGPSLIGVSSGNKVQDDSVRAFVKWILTTETDVTFKANPEDVKKGLDKDKVTTPIKFIEDAFSYIIPVKGYDKATEEQINQIFGHNSYLKQAFASFKDTAAEDSKVKLYEEPASEYSDTFRDQIRAGLDSLQKAATSKSAAPTFETFISGLKKEAPRQ